jgi:prepilin-type N-terminal cleavage/methylation domain-containing protein
MNLGKRSHGRRGGFTLIELLVVIGIIVILMALLVPAVMHFTTLGPVAVAQNDINQLNISVQNFCTTYNVKFIPSQIKLCEKYNQYILSNQLDQDSVNYLTSLWPQLTASGGPWTTISAGIDWNGNGSTSDHPVTLEGDQCLVFFLGGIPIPGATPGVLGFSTNPRDPSLLSQTTGRKGPYFEFPSAKLFKRTNATAGSNALLAANAGYYSFGDGYNHNPQVPYAYFSSYGTRNGYNRYGTTLATSDCTSLGVQPYFVGSATQPQYQNPTGYQIICAGADGKFGAGGLWTPGTISGPGADDQSNFNKGNLLNVSN